MKLFRTITLMLVLLAAVPVAFVGLMLITNTVDIIKTLTWELEQERTEHAGREASSYLENILDDLDLLISNLDLDSMSIEQQQKLLGRILQKRSETNILGFFNSRAQPMRNLQAYDAERIIPSEMAMFQQGIRSTSRQRAELQAIAFSKPYHFDRKAKPESAMKSRKESVVAVLIRLNSHHIAYLGLELSLSPLESLVARLRASRGGTLMLLDSELEIIAQSTGTEASSMQNPRQQLSNLTSALSSVSTSIHVSGTRPFRLPNGRQVLLSYSPVVHPNWLMVSVEPLDDAYLTSRTMIWQVLEVVSVSLLVAVGLGVLFAFGLTRPIGKLVRGSIAVARGKFGTQIEVKANNELRELAHTFNYMSSQLKYYDEHNQELIASLEQGYLETLRALANSIDAKDPYTAGHSDRVTNLALAIGKQMGLDGEQLNVLRYAGILHDIGKIGIPEEILGKTTELTEQERAEIENHPELGDKIIEPIDFLQPVRPLVRHHHEWIDGTGYPDGLRGDEIPLGARILAAADTFDAITSDRPYQQATSKDTAMEIIRGLSGRQLDPKVCEALETVLTTQSDIDHTNRSLRYGPA